MSKDPRNAVRAFLDRPTCTPNGIVNIGLGSKNPVKRRAVLSALSAFQPLSVLKVVGIPVDSGINPQPLTLSEMLHGAYNRAYGALQWSGYLGIGIESGLQTVDVCSNLHHIAFTTIDIAVCVVLADPDVPWIGTSSGFVVPPDVEKAILKHEPRGQYTLDDGFREAGLTELEHLGHDMGAIGYLTKGRTTREAQVAEAVRNALIPLMNPELF